MARPCTSIHPDLVPDICYYCWLYSHSVVHQYVDEGLPSTEGPPPQPDVTFFTDYPSWWYSPPFDPPAGSGSGPHLTPPTP